MVKYFKTEKNFESVHLACARRNRTSEYTCLSGDLCDKRTKPTPLTAFQTIFGIFHIKFSRLFE